MENQFLSIQIRISNVLIHEDKDEPFFSYHGNNHHSNQVGPHNPESFKWNKESAWVQHPKEEKQSTQGG